MTFNNLSYAADALLGSQLERVAQNELGPFTLDQTTPTSKGLKNAQNINFWSVFFIFR